MLSRLLDGFRGTDLTWLDAIDILIVAFIIYQLLLFLRGTHAVQIVLGGAVVVLLYWMAKWLDLQTVNWLLQTLIPYVVFGAIVIFAGEIRKALAHLGKTPLLGAFGSRKTEELVDEVVLAATTLAGKRTGAIVVIEKEMGLRAYIETGIALDSVVTYDLLVSVFNPGAPLHDGAVVISGNRVAAAACFLPLTVNPHLTRALGSRHRAAIGVTEDTDAVAVVVSEESGWISLVSSGEIQRDMNARSLKHSLLLALEVQETEDPGATTLGSAVPAPEQED